MNFGSSRSSGELRHGSPKPPGSNRRRRARSFLRRAALRYGPQGEFWEDNPELTPEPISSWEIWNEPNIVTFGSADPAGFAKILRAAGQILHRVEPGSKVILGGLFGRPLQIPPNIHFSRPTPRK